ncbi:MAG TPA: TIGR01777 family oxidoreductase [Cyclobacteriaceae bacterium]|nr:TIGR01777 family oxidoreductase [Cyclobacteriaceae bacterium]
MSKILITGASGLIGTRLIEMLLQHGHEVVRLSRSKGLLQERNVQSFVWDVSKGTVEEEAFHGVDAVVHLAGASVADQRWTEKRKREILESRTKSTALLAQFIERNPQVKVLISASGIGYYGEGTDHVFTEEDKQGSDFLALVVDAWEKKANKIPCKRIVKLRTGIVLSEKGGALKEMMAPIKFFVGAPLGTGRQYMSWIHIDDLCRMFIKAIEDETMNGVYNATGPYAVTNTELTTAIAKVLRRPLWLPNVPGFVLKILLGEMADMVLTGSQVSSKKIQQKGFQFQFSDLHQALENLLRKS